MGSPQFDFCPTVVWSTEMDSPPIARLLLAGDLVLAPTRAGQLYAVNLQDDVLCWEKTFEHAQVSGLASAPSDMTLVATFSTDPFGRQGALTALDAAGTERWPWSPGAQRVSAPAVVEDMVCVTVDSRMLVILDAATGRERAQSELEAIASPSAPALVGGVAYIPCRGPHLLAVGLDGRMRWHFVSPADKDAWLDKTPVGIGDLLFAVLSTGAVLALHASDGSLARRIDAGPARKPLSPPATDGVRLFVGSQSGLHAFDPTGAALWHFPTTRKIAAAPAVADGVVYATCHDHRLYALDAESGQELWRVELKRRIEVSPAVGGDFVLAADCGGRLVAIERRLSAERYASKGRWTEAAVAYYLRGEPNEAARINWDQLDQPLRAAELWEEAGDAERAAACYAQAGRCDRAEELYLQAGRTLQAAEMARLQGAYERAGPLYEQEGAWSKALECYQSLSEQHAADQPTTREQTRRTHDRVTEKQILRTPLRDLLVDRFTLEDLRQLCFDLEIDHENLGGEEKTAKARALILYLEHRSRLADLVRVGREQRTDVPWQDAIQAIEEPLYLAPDPTLGGPYALKIAELSARLGKWKRAGKEWATLGEFESAAKAFVRAARRAEQDAPDDEARLADLWAAAEVCYEEAFDEDQALECHCQVARYRHLPCVEVQILPPETMVRGQYARSQLVLHNAGGGAARHMIVPRTLSDSVVDPSKTEEIRGLAPGGTKRRSLYICSTASGLVPLWITVDYQDTENRPYQANCYAQITVREPS